MTPGRAPKFRRVTMWLWQKRSLFKKKNPMKRPSSGRQNKGKTVYIRGIMKSQEMMRTPCEKGMPSKLFVRKVVYHVVNTAHRKLQCL